MALTALDVIVFEWCMIALTAVLVATRLYVRSSTSIRNARDRTSTIPTAATGDRRWWSWSDFFVVLAWIGFLTLGALDTAHYVLGYLMIVQTKNEHEIPWEKLQMSYKIQYARDPEYLVCMYAIKAAMLCFYHEFIPKERMFKAWIAMKLLCVVVGLSWVYSTTMLLFNCIPITQWWSSDEWPEHCWYKNPDTSIIAIHLATDFLIYILPLFVLYSCTSLSTQQKVHAGFMFFIGFGLLLIAAAVYAVQTVPSWNEEGTPLAAWPLNTAEQTAAIFVACAPAFRTWLVRGVLGRSPSPIKRHKSRVDNGSWGDSTLVAGTVVSVREIEEGKVSTSIKGGRFQKIEEEVGEFDFGIQVAEGRIVRGSGVNEIVMEIPRPLDDIEIESQKRFPSVVFRELTVDTGVDDMKCIMPPGTATTR